MTVTVEQMTAVQRASALALFQGLGYDPAIDAHWFDHFTIGDPTCPAEMRLVAVDQHQVVGFAVGCVRDQRLIVKFVAVSPEHRRRGVGSALLRRLEDVGLSQGLASAHASGVGPNFFYPGVDLTLTPALSFFWRHGYQTDRVARVDMQVDLTSDVLETKSLLARLSAEGLGVRRLTSDDLAAVAELAGTLTDVWRQEVWLAGRNDPISAFAAFVGSEPVAFAAYGVTGPHRFGPTLTRPDYRERGIGGVLLKLCLAEIRALGWDRAEITWAGPVHYYARAVGAIVHRAYWGFSKDLPAAAHASGV